MEQITAKEFLQWQLDAYKEATLDGYTEEEQELLRHLELDEDPEFDKENNIGAAMVQARKDDDVFRFVVSEYTPEFPGAPAPDEAYLRLLALFVTRGILDAHYETVLRLEDRNAQLN